MADGTSIRLNGPEAGRRHNMLLYVASGIEEVLPTLVMVHGKPHVKLGKSGYTWRVYLQMPYRGANLDSVRSSLSKAISKVRVSVECYFMEVKRLWGLIDAKRRLRIAQMLARLI